MTMFKVGDSVRLKAVPNDIKDEVVQLAQEVKLGPRDIRWIVASVMDREVGDAQMYELLPVDKQDDSTWELYEEEIAHWWLPVTPDELEATYHSLGVTDVLPLGNE